MGGLVNLVMLPMSVGSGVFFATSNFPNSVQPILRVLPLTVLNDGLRAVINEGAGARAMASAFLTLAAWGLASVCIGAQALSMAVKEPRVILHVDMDAFYASVEQRDDPALRGKPVIVGGHSRRGVVLAASYEVRIFGVRSAMPMAEALRRAPNAIVVSPHRERYEQASEDAFAIFRRYTPLVEPLSLDEAFLDVTGSQALFGDGESIARAIKRDIRQKLQLTASAGVAECKFAARIAASDLRKPDGLVVVPPGGVASFLEPLPASRRMWGVGPRDGAEDAGARLRDDPATSRAPGGQRARGERSEAGASKWDSWRAATTTATSTPKASRNRSAPRSRTSTTSSGRRPSRPPFSRTRGAWPGDMVRAGLWAQTVALKIKCADFTLRTRRAALPAPVQDTDAIHRAAVDLLTRVPLEARSVRLTGVSVSGISEREPAPELFPDASADKRRRLEEVSARIADRYGDEEAITRATLLDKTR